MKKAFTIFFVLILAINLQAQINMNDSTAQVVAYWNLHEKQVYQVTHEKYKIKGTDTTYTDYWKYIVDITIKDSAANSYTIDWFYHDYEIEEENELRIYVFTIICRQTQTDFTLLMHTLLEVRTE